MIDRVEFYARFRQILNFNDFLLTFIWVLFLIKMFETSCFFISAILLIIWFDDDLHVGTITKTSSAICIASSNLFIEGIQIICLALLVGPLKVKEVQKSESDQKVN
jgi:hypothetical protein